jgi:DNA transformation protein
MSQDYCNYLCGIFEPFAPVSGKRMFGGHGLFVDGLMFGLVADNCLYLKIDSQTKDLFLDEGLEAFTYMKKGKPIHLSFHQAPEEIYEDSEQAGIWFNRAYAAAIRSKKTKTG